jgi:hypothetical protein
MTTCILYTVSAIGIVGFLWWNTGNEIHLREFHIAKYFRVHAELSGRLVPSHEQMQNVSNYNDGAPSHVSRAVTEFLNKNISKEDG